MLRSLVELFRRGSKPEPQSPEELRLAFRGRYHLFKLLLNANNKALDIMTEMEEALKGTWPFGMSFVRSRCTSVSTSVFQIVKNLNDLAPGKYGALFSRFKEIQMKVNPFISPKTLSRDGALVKPLREVDKSMADLVGSKMANLAEIGRQVDFRIPGGFAITAPGYDLFIKHNDLQAEIDQRIQSTNVEQLDQLFSLSASIQQLIMASPLPPDLERAILEQYRFLEEEAGKGVRVALRSSALGEDVPGTSFAGQYRSELNVSGEHILEAYKNVVASKYSLTAMTYRLNRGIRDEEVAMCVGCMQMVDALSGGVMYSRNPLDIRDEAVVINALWGLPKSVVDGSAATDLFVVSRGDSMAIREKVVPVKDQKFVCYPEEGVCRLDVTGEESRSASLTDDQAKELARLAVRIEAYYQRPQDIEWAVDRAGSVVILQCRPLLQKAESAKSRLEAKDEGRARVLLKGGVTAGSGVGSGPVFIARKDMDALQFPAGGVLVAEQSLPRWATLLSRAAAVVTEQGSIAGHLANVSREFGVPALFGVDGAMTGLENGRTVTVDADGLRIYEGRVEELLVKTEKPRNLMEGSPVFDALKGAAEQIIPLHLLDPDAPAFKAERCRTFHDITRFCHEKSVHEMFQFGKEHQFPERSSKQLLCDVPMQWWVLNLDDGFREEVEGRYVKLENIVSIPMQALWEGITAKPWEGPPPVDGKGLMSVMFEATRNTALVAGGGSAYGAKNYFIISKNYCSLSSRLGFHFSIVEGLVSERARENYISFQFKGGAADFERRHRRVVFVKELLEEYGFRASVREDNLLSRIEDRDEEFMKSRLRVLGFLTIHTRQLDMVMANPVSYQHYQAKIHQDIRELLKIE
ncbi:MAG: PEP-utilizing enzyme [Deltaproteobacteria bacterium]|nr:PEP-utilizing enzyme [Deltaproteobacteria bacterium]